MSSCPVMAMEGSRSIMVLDLVTVQGTMGTHRIHQTLPSFHVLKLCRYVKDTRYKHTKLIPQINVKINNTVIEQVREFHFLGITFDQYLTWKHRIVSNFNQNLVNYRTTSQTETLFSSTDINYNILFIH